MSMGMRDRVSTGHKQFDEVIDDLRLGDNVVWQVDRIQDYEKMCHSFVRDARAQGRDIYYIRFGHHAPIFSSSEGLAVIEADAGEGFERFTSSLYDLITQAGYKAFYVFDCLSDLLTFWHSDLMIRNFFKIICPYLYQLDTVAYFALSRNAHTNSTIAGIRETTQLLLDLYHLQDGVCVHPLKVWKRYSPTMFLPHKLVGEQAFSITSSAEASVLFSNIHRAARQEDYWLQLFEKARQTLDASQKEQEASKTLLISMLLGGHVGMFDLCQEYFSTEDLLRIASREIGTGFIGGKSVGMLLARAILKAQAPDLVESKIEPHDSFFLGADIYYSYIVQNGWWGLRTRQKKPEEYFTCAPEFKEKLLSGKFSEDIQEQFWQMLEYFGQSPIIVRSSSLLEDNFGNAFAGKYESVFCVNQGSPQARFDAFEQAIRTIYASTMNEDALEYRRNRGLSEMDEQMAILVQRVSGDYHAMDFFPHAAGVGNSANLYVWDREVDPDAGMLRLVFGLGTRAVDRTSGDYVKIVTLDDPLRLPPVHPEDIPVYSQHELDALSLADNTLLSRPIDQIDRESIKTDPNLFFTPDFTTMQRLRSLGYKDRKAPDIVDFNGMLKNTDFPEVMRRMLKTLSDAYNYPVDIEFTVNFSSEKDYRINLLQCRPLQTKSIGQPIAFPENPENEKIFFSTRGQFMGGNISLNIDHIIYIRPSAYLKLSERDKYQLARHVGDLNQKLKDKTFLLAGPGRWGTTTPSLGIPVRFSEICNATVLCEMSSEEDGFMPELSYGSHFFQDLVESGIFYAAIFDGKPDVMIHPEYVLNKENQLRTLLLEYNLPDDVMHVMSSSGAKIYSDVTNQRLLCGG